MSFVNDVTKKAWPRWGVHKETGERARFDYPGALGRKYRLEEPLPPKIVSAQVEMPEQNATIADLKAQVEALTALIKKKAG